MKRTVDTPYCAVPLLNEALETQWFVSNTAAWTWVAAQSEPYDVQYRPKRGKK